MIYFWTALAILLVWVKNRYPDECPKCGERCTPQEADFLFGFPCWACCEEEELLRQIKNGHKQVISSQENV